MVTRASAGSSSNVFIVPSGAIGDGDPTKAAANTTAVNAALTAAGTAGPVKPPLASGGGGEGGPTVFLPDSHYYINNTLNIPNGVTLQGGGLGTRITLANGSATAAAPKSMVKAVANSNFVKVCDLTLDGNKANQTDTGYASHGVDFTRAGTAELYDGLFYCENVLVFGCQGVGINFYGTANTAHAVSCYAYHNDADGFALKTDQTVVACIAGNNGGNGFAVYNGTSVSLGNCKSFGNGARLINSSDFFVYYSNDVTMTGCRSEDYGEMGFRVGSSRHVLLTGCHVYRQDIAGVETGDPHRCAFWLEDDGAGNKCDYVRIVGCGAHGDIASGRGILNVFTIRNLGVGNEINIAADGYTSELFHMLSGTGVEAATVRVNNSDGLQSVAYASSITPNPLLGGTHVIGALTAGITIANVVAGNRWTGQRMTIRFLQDATGGRTVSWGSDYDVAGWTVVATANARSAINLLFDGTKWTAVR